MCIKNLNVFQRPHDQANVGNLSNENIAECSDTAFWLSVFLQGKIGNCYFNCAVTRITKAGPTVPIYVASDHVLFYLFIGLFCQSPWHQWSTKRIGCQTLTKHPKTKWSQAMGAFGRLGWFWSTTLASLVDCPLQEVTWAPPYTQHRTLGGFVHPCKFDLTNSRRPAAIARRPWRRRERWLRLAWAPSSRPASLNMTPSLVSIEEA